MKDEAAKAADFERVIGPRVDKALHAIGLIANGADARSYSVTLERATFIVNQLSAAVAVVAEAFGLGRPPPHPFAEDAPSLGVVPTAEPPTRQETTVSALAALYGADYVNPGDPEYTPDDYLSAVLNVGEVWPSYVAYVRAKRAAEAHLIHKPKGV